MDFRLRLMAGTALTAVALATPALAQGGDTVTMTRDQYEAIMQRLERLERGAPATAPAAANPALEQRVQDLEISQNARINKLENDASAVKWSFENSRPVIATGDGRFSMAIRGRFHFDAGMYSQDPGPNVPGGSGEANVRDLGAGSFFRRAHIGVEGKVFRDFDYEFRYNFGGSAEEASGAIHTMRIAYNPTPEFRINVGAMQPTFTLDNSTSSNDIMFLERSSVTNALVEEFGGSDSRKGIELTYLKTGASDGKIDFMLNAAYTTSRIGVRNAPADDRDHLLGRAALRYKASDALDFHVGANAASILGTGGQDDSSVAGTVRFRDRPELRIDPARLVDSSAINAEGGFMWGLEAGLRYKSLTVQGEYFGWDVDLDRECAACSLTAQDPDFDGYYVQASYILTGENRIYNSQSTGNSRMNFGAPRPASPFSTGGTWGAWELAARYSVLDLDYDVGPAGTARSSSRGEIRGGKQAIVSASLNWYLNRNIRLMFQYQNVDVERLNNAGLDIGQNYDSFAVRTQFAF